MKSRVFDARHLDVKAFAKAGERLAGAWPLSGFERLAPVLAPGVELGDVSWEVQGKEEPVLGGAARTWLELQARASLQLVCQRCLQPCAEPVEVQRRFLFVADEATAERLDEELDDEVLVLSRDLDLHDLLEDELLLDLPLVPRHAQCPQPLVAPAEAGTDADAAPTNPFAVLAGLKAGSSGQGSGG